MTLLRLLCTLLFVSNNVVHANMADRMMHDLAEGAEKVKESVQGSIHNMHHEVDALLKNSALAGNVWPVVKKLVITPEKAKLIATKTGEVIHWQDLVRPMSALWRGARSCKN